VSEFTSYSVDNDRTFRRALDKAAGEMSDLRIPFRLIAFDFYKSQGAIFGLKGPGQYPDLSTKPFTAWWEKGALRRRYSGGYKEYKKAKYGFAYPILRARGALEEAASKMGGRGNITQIQAARLTMGVDDAVVPYAKFHQSDGSRGLLPQRKFLFIGPEAPRFATSEQTGRLERWMGILDSFTRQRLEAIGNVSSRGGTV